jgi:DNA repair protein RecO (recombination protein O)
MSAEKALALVVRTIDWSETSRIATLWTREFGKVRVLAKGGRRLKSNFEAALDLLTLCQVVFLRKSSASLDLLTEAQVTERFPVLRVKLPALYAGYYIAELLAEGTEDYDPHPALFDAAVEALRDFGSAEKEISLRLAAFELAWLQELWYSPLLDSCAGCHRPLARDESGLAFSAASGGLLCRDCQAGQRDRIAVSGELRRRLRDLSGPGTAWREDCRPAERGEIRRLLGQYICYVLGKRPRLLAYISNLP